MMKSVIFFVLFAISLCVAAPQTYQVFAGPTNNNNSPTAPWTIAAFFPNNLTIHVGDSVAFTVQGDAHTMTFYAGQNISVISDFRTLAYAPQIFPFGSTNVTDPWSIYSSGISAPEMPPYVFNFPVAGAFPFMCILHPYMRGVVYVVDPKQNITSSAAVSTAANAAAAAQVAVLNNIPIPTPPSAVLAPNGRNYIHTIGVGFAYPPYFASYMRFIPSNLTITVGDSINFTSWDFGAHTVAFNSSGVFNDNDIFGEDGLLHANPNYFVPNGNAANYTGGFLSLGVLGQEPLTPFQYGVVTFNQVGVFPYICSLHDTMGMVGQITVEAAPPSTTGTTQANQASTTGAASTTQAASSASTLFISCLYLVSMILALIHM